MRYGRTLAAIVSGMLAFFLSLGGAGATTVTSGDTITVGFGALPPASLFNPFFFTLQLNASDPFGPNESFRGTLFNAANVQFSTSIQSSGLTSWTSFLTGPFSGPVDNTGHFIIDQIVGSFDLASISVSIQFFGVEPVPFNPVIAQFEVNSSTPLPGALPLFATGLGALGLLGWRRKRKANA